MPFPREVCDGFGRGNVGRMTGRRAWNREQEARRALAGAGVLHMLLRDDADTHNVVHAQLEDAEVAVWTLTAFGAAAVRLLAEATGKTVEQAHADVVRDGYGGFVRVWPGRDPSPE